MQEKQYIRGTSVKKLDSLDFESRILRDIDTTKKEEEKALPIMGPKTVIAYAVVVVFMLSLCIINLSINSEIKTTYKSITKLKQDISALEAKNEAIDYALNSQIDTKEIIKKAKKLGMQFAKEDQYITYKDTEDEYLVQYKDIPEE